MHFSVIRLANSLMFISFSLHSNVTYSVSPFLVTVQSLKPSQHCCFFPSPQYLAPSNMTIYHVYCSPILPLPLGSKLLKFKDSFFFVFWGFFCFLLTTKCYLTHHRYSINICRINDELIGRKGKINLLSIPLCV